MFIKIPVKNLDSQWYNFDYLKTHNIQLLDGEVYFCEVKPNNAGWNRENFIGVESDNICKLVNELDTRTNSEYQLYDNFIK